MSQHTMYRVQTRINPKGCWLNVSAPGTVDLEYARRVKARQVGLFPNREHRILKESVTTEVVE